MNMEFTLYMTFMAKEGQSPVIYSVVEEMRTQATVMLEKEEPITSPSLKLELSEHPDVAIESKQKWLNNQTIGSGSPL